MKLIIGAGVGLKMDKNDEKCILLLYFMVNTNLFWSPIDYV